MKLITISGVDGSGKSTQLKLLKENLEQEGKKVFYFHAVEFSLANRLARFFKKKKPFIPGKEKALMKASWFSLWLRKIFLIADIFRFKTLMRKLEGANYEYILSDRYLYDSIINILYLSKNKKAVCFEKYIPKPDTAFYLHIPAEEIMRRKRVPEQGIDYLKQKMKIFDRKKEVWQMASIDASQSKEAIERSIFSHIFVA